MPDSRRSFGFLAAVLVCPISAYVLTWIIGSLEQLLSGHGFHPFRPFFGVGIISMFSLGHHQWSPITILVYYVICLAVALPLLAVLRFRAVHRRAASCIVWAVACGTYFFLLDRPFGFGWLWGFYGVVAGVPAGFFHYFLAYVPTNRSA